MANTWIVRFYNKGEFRFTDPNAEEFSSLSSYEQKMITKLLHAELDIEFPIEPKVGMKIELCSFGNIANDSSAIMCYLNKFQSVTIEKMIIYSRYILLQLDIQKS